MALRFVRNFWDSVTGSIRPLGSDFDGLAPKMAGFAAATDSDGLTTKSQVEEMIADASPARDTKFMLTVVPAIGSSTIHGEGDSIEAAFPAIQSDDTTFNLIFEGMFYNEDAFNYSIKVIDPSDSIILTQPVGKINSEKWKLYCSFSVKAGQDGDPDPFEGEYPIAINVVKDLGGDDEDVVTEFYGVVEYEAPE